MDKQQYEAARQQVLETVKNPKIRAKKLAGLKNTYQYHKYKEKRTQVKESVIYPQLNSVPLNL